MMRVLVFVRQNSLGLFFGVIFIGALIGQSFAGLATYNQQQVSDHLMQIGYLEYVTSSSFSADVAENWQSEYLQFLLYIWATVWLVQRGSPESKKTSEAGPESDADQKIGRFAEPNSPPSASAGGFRRAVFSHSLLLTMGAIFLLSWLAQSISGTSAFNETQLNELQSPVSWSEYIREPDFWNRTLQNWQSEFLAVGSMAVLSIYLREKGSSESKAVGEAHATTGA